jgi:hypothetical protein
MCWLGELERRARDAVGNVPAAHAPISQPAKPQSKPDIKAVPVQTAAAVRRQPWAITVGYYSVQDDVVVMHDEAGILTGKRQHWREGRIPAA